MSPVVFTHEFLSRPATKIKEQSPFRRILRKRYVASLFTTIPNRIASITRHCRSLFCNPCAKQAGSRYSESLIRRYSPVVGAIKQLFRLSEISFSELDLPSFRFRKGRIFLVVPRIGHINDNGIAIFKDSPSRNSRTFDIKLYDVSLFKIKRPYIYLRLTRNTFKPRTKSDKLSVRRYFRMVDRHRIRNFRDIKHAAGIIQKREVTRYIIPEGKSHLIGIRVFSDGRRIQERKGTTHDRVSLIVNPCRFRNTTETKTETHICRPRRRRHRIDISASEYKKVLLRRLIRAALDHPFSETPPIRRTHIIHDSRIKKLAEPIVGPFHGVSHHIARNILIFFQRTDLVQLVVRIFSKPSLFCIPILIRNKHPFRLGGQTVRLYFRVKNKALNSDAMMQIIKRHLGISIGRIQANRLTHFIRIEDRIVIGNICRRKVIVLTFQLKSRRRDHYFVEFGTSDLMTP